jgi:hypothetical protein
LHLRFFLTGNVIFAIIRGVGNRTVNGRIKQMGVNLNANSAWAALMANAKKPQPTPTPQTRQILEIVVKPAPQETPITAMDHQKFAVIVDQLRKRLRIRLRTENYAKCTRSWIEYALLTRATDTKCGSQMVTREYIQLMQITAREAANVAGINPTLVRQRIHPMS